MSKIQKYEAIGPLANVRVSAIDIRTGVTLATRETHNVLTDIGRNWFRDLSASSSYALADANGGQIPLADSRTNERPRFIGLGVGGALSSDPTTYFGTQEELPGVTAIEDYVQITGTRYLKELHPQTPASSSFPDSYTLVYIADFLSTEVAFAGNTSKSGHVVGTSVPVTEAGLYLSAAAPTSNLDNATNTARLVAYNIFTPVTVTPNVVLRVEWEFLF